MVYLCDKRYSVSDDVLDEALSKGYALVVQLDAGKQYFNGVQ